jgi:uncharacterized protein YdbL (DUF1318 family)
LPVLNKSNDVSLGSGLPEPLNAYKGGKKMTKINLKFAFMLSVIIFAACVTVNIYFPAAEVRQAAEEIAKDVRGQESSQDPADTGAGEPQSFLNLIGTAYAQQELDISNATIRQIKERMKARYAQLVPFLKQGVIGESAKGFMIIRDTSSIDLKARAEVNRQVSAENSDRTALYSAVSKALNVSGSELARVQEIFAKEWQKTAPAGTWIESESGKWEQR